MAACKMKSWLNFVLLYLMQWCLHTFCSWIKVSYCSILRCMLNRGWLNPCWLNRRNKRFKVHESYAIGSTSIVGGGCEKGLTVPLSFYCFLHRNLSAFEDWWIPNIQRKKSGLISVQFRLICGVLVSGLYEGKLPLCNRLHNCFHNECSVFWQYLDYWNHKWKVCSS